MCVCMCMCLLVSCCAVQGAGFIGLHRELSRQLPLSWDCEPLRPGERSLKRFVCSIVWAAVDFQPCMSSFGPTQAPRLPTATVGSTVGSAVAMDRNAGGHEGIRRPWAECETMWTAARVRDCLSLAFAFLPIRDYACVLRCSRTWHAVARQKTAWPSVSVDAVTDSIRNNEYNRSACRRVVINVNRSLLRRGLQCASQSSVWGKRIEDLHVWAGGYKPSGDGAPKNYDDAALRAVASLPALRVLNLGLIAPSAAAVRACFTQHAPKLEILLSNVPNEAVLSSLSMLLHLRSLAVKITRLLWARSYPIGSGHGALLAKALLALTQLRYPHYEDAGFGPLAYPVAAPPPTLGEELESPKGEAGQVLTAVSHLSTHHALRHLSLRWRRSCRGEEPGMLDLAPLLQHPSGLQLEHLQLDLRTTASAMVALLALATRTRLDWH